MTKTLNNIITDLEKARLTWQAVSEAFKAEAELLKKEEDRGLELYYELGAQEQNAWEEYNTLMNAWDQAMS